MIPWKPRTGEIGVRNEWLVLNGLIANAEGDGNKKFPKRMSDKRKLEVVEEYCEADGVIPAELKSYREYSYWVRKNGYEDHLLTDEEFSKLREDIILCERSYNLLDSLIGGICPEAKGMLTMLMRYCIENSVPPAAFDMGLQENYEYYCHGQSEYRGFNKTVLNFSELYEFMKGLCSLLELVSSLYPLKD